jgi:hypothetical protein
MSTGRYFIKKYNTTTDSTWIPIAAESRLMPLSLNGPNRYTVEDKRNTANAKPATTTRFGPSGSLKKKSSSLEQIRAVAARITNEIVLDLKYRFAVLLTMSVK